MSKKTFFQLLLMICMGVSTDAFAQKDQFIDSIKVVNFSNEFLQKGKAGKLFVVNSNEFMSYVVVHWKNGYTSFGTIQNGKEVGEWYLYDKKNRLREYIMFGFEGKCILQSKKLNKKGSIIAEFKAITPCF